MRKADRLSVLLATEGTYPYRRGGVSTWCDALTRRLPDVDFRLLAVTMHPYLTPEYAAASNVTDLVTIPLWGTQHPAEYLWQDSFREYLERRSSTNDEEIEERFVPQYGKLLSEIINPVVPPRALGLVLLRLHLELQHVDYHLALTSPAVWDVFDRVVRDGWRNAFPGDPPPSVTELREAWQNLYRLLLPLAIEPSRVDIAHSSAAGVCGLPCIMAKLRWGTPYLLTEHEVYLREQYRHLERIARTLFGRWFLSRVMSTIADVNYAFADQVSPVCEHNTRWERWRHVDASRIQVIHNGVDPDKFSPASRQPNGRPTIVSIGQISPLKGQLDLIEAAALVHRHVPDAVFRLYGSVVDEAYFRRCEGRLRELELTESVVFAGYTRAPWTALRAADVVAFPSVSEAFPFAVIEAMSTECAIVATDVGGVREAIGDAGALTPPHDPEALAGAIVALLRSPERRSQLGRLAREGLRRSFTEDHFAGAYRDVYTRLVTTSSEMLVLQNVATA